MRARHLFLAALSLAALPAWACQLRLAPESWPPYIYSDAEGQLAGADIELVQAIFKEAGCTLDIVPELPSLRREMLFRQGKLDLMLAALPYVPFSAAGTQWCAGNDPCPLWFAVTRTMKE